MKKGIAAFLILLASCVVPYEHSQLIARSSIIDHPKTNLAYIDNLEFYPSVTNPCREDYSSVSMNHEYLMKLDCLSAKISK